ncbi:MAG: RyR domain-containing protein [Pseudomonadota bacterium]
MALRVFLRWIEPIFRRRAVFFFWILAGLLGLAAVASGAYGWWIEPDAQRGALGVVDALFRGLKSIFFSDMYSAKTITVDTPFLLASRYLGGGFFLLMAGRIVLFTAGERASELLLRARSRHDVVIGDGEAALHYCDAAPGRLSTHVSETLAARLDRSAVMIRRGDLMDQLQRAGAGRARRIVVGEGRDALAWTTAQAAAMRYPDIDVIVHIADPWLHERLSRADPAARLRPFSYVSGAARHVMLAHPPYLLARAYGAPAQHIIIVGFGSLGQALLREFLVTSIAEKPEAMMATIIDPQADRLKAEFEARHPGLEGYADVQFLQGSLLESDPTVEAAFLARAKRCEACGVYVAVSEDDYPLRTGVGLRDRAERLGLFRAPIFVRGASGSGLRRYKSGPGLVGRSPTHDAPQAKPGERVLAADLALIPFGDWRDALDGADLLTDHIDKHAETFHEGYRRLTGALDVKDKSKLAPSQQPWPLLSEEFRVANRRSVAHARAKLDAAGFALGRWLEDGDEAGQPHRPGDLPPAADELPLDDPVRLDRLGALEHRRWAIDRTLNGWTYGEVRDNRAKRHPDLVTNRELDEVAKEKDRNNIRQVAQIIRDMIGEDDDDASNPKQRG